MLNFDNIDQSKADNYDFTNCYTKCNPGKPYNSRDVAAAIYVTKGCYSNMAKLLGRRRNGVKYFVEGNAGLRELFNETLESTIDILQSDVVDSAIKGNEQDRRFVLTTLGKGRGFSTRIENTGKDGEPIQTQEVGAKSRFVSKIQEFVDRRKNVEKTEE